MDSSSAEEAPQDSGSAEEDTRDSGSTEVGVWQMGDKLQSLANSPEDYRRFYHNINGKKVRHDKVHNLYGFNMTRAACEAFERIDPDRRFLMFSALLTSGCTGMAASGQGITNPGGPPAPEP